MSIQYRSRDQTSSIVTVLSISALLSPFTTFPTIQASRPVLSLNSLKNSFEFSFFILINKPPLVSAENPSYSLKLIIVLSNIEVSFKTGRTSTIKFTFSFYAPAKFYAWPNMPKPVISVAELALYFFINFAASKLSIPMYIVAFS